MALSLYRLKMAKLRAEKEEKERKKSEAPTQPVVRDIQDEDNVKTWSVVLNGETTAIFLNRNKMEVTCNGKVVENTIHECGPHTITISFSVANKDAQITTRQGVKRGDDLIYTLTIDGQYVPGASFDLDERF